MKIDTRMGAYADIRALVPAHAATLDAIRDLVHRTDPQGVEVASPGERSVWWSVAGNKMKDGYSYDMPHGAHVKITSVEDVARPEIAALVHAAVEERRGAVG